VRVEVSEAGGSNLPNSVTTPNKRQQLPAEHDRRNRANQEGVFAEMRVSQHHHCNCDELTALLPIAAVCVNLRQGAMTPILTAI
jgi:hypothetical protein